MEKLDVGRVKKTIDEIPESSLEEVYDYLEFLKWRATKREIEFDEWARNLAKARGFDHLTEDDVAKIVKECRREQNV